MKRDWYYPDLEIGKIYKNDGGGSYVCCNKYGKDAWMANVKSGWFCHCHNVVMYRDKGTIEWDYSTDGYFEDLATIL